MLTPSGLRNIEDIEVADTVYSVDVETGRRFPNKVEALVRGVESRFVRLRLADGRALQMTPTHRFFDPQTSAWVEARSLASGAALLAVEGSALAAEEEGPLERASISDLESLETRPQPVYNLTVSGPHRNYLAEGVLVHNLKGRYNER